MAYLSLKFDLNPCARTDFRLGMQGRNSGERTAPENAGRGKLTSLRYVSSSTKISRPTAWSWR